MGKIFILAGRGGEQGREILDPRVAVERTMATQQMIFLRNRVVTELKQRGCEVLAVPDDLSLPASIQWINERSCFGDIALEIDTETVFHPSLRGASVYYITHNIERRKHAELMLLLLMHYLPQILSRGTKPDTAAEMGSLSFCRRVLIPSLAIRIGFFSNPDDRALVINYSEEIATGLTDGLMAWSREVSGVEPNEPSSDLVYAPIYPAINIKLNNQDFEEKGILINGNPFIPIDLAERLGIHPLQIPDVRLVQYRGVVYVRAIELREFNLSIGWNNFTRALVLRSILPICVGQMERIMGHGYTSDRQLTKFLKENNENAPKDFADVPKIYQEEASIEGVNYDIAFCQMCLETGFMRFGPSENNFSRLGAVGGTAQYASFPSPQIGVRAQIQHLKAYASLEPLVKELVDPRFHLVTRGVAPVVPQLSGRWSADLFYGNKIMAILRRLYESANLL